MNTKQNRRGQPAATGESNAGQRFTYPNDTTTAAKLQPVTEIQRLLAQADAKMQAAPDDEIWVRHYLVWLELFPLAFAEKMLARQGGGE
jgi:hypothetical protein